MTDEQQTQRTINATFDNDEFQELRQIKENRLGRSWEQAIVAAFDALADREGLDADLDA